MARTTTNSSSRVGGSTRLTKLHSYYQNEKHIWDIGCDHGYLGSSFKDIESVEVIHLVDPSLPVIQSLKDSYISIRKIMIHHNEGQRLTFNSPSNLIFIAGMGGKEIGEIIVHLLPQLDSASRLIISPHRKIIELRTLLSELPLSLTSEEVIEEDEQFYQILELTPNPHGMKVPVYGEQLWASHIGEKYRNHQLKHYKAHKDLASLGYVAYLESLKPLKTTTK